MPKKTILSVACIFTQSYLSDKSTTKDSGDSRLFFFPIEPEVLVNFELMLG